MPLYTPQLVERARDLRKDMTKQERRLWYGFLRNHPIKFYRQRPIGGYIADFYCRKLKLVIEIDGEQHRQSVEYDNERTESMESLDLKVIRFSNNEVDYDFESVCKKINEIANLEEEKIL